MYSDISIICLTLENNGLNNTYEYYHMTKEKSDKKLETEEQLAIRKEIRKEWSLMEPRLIEMAHKLEDNELIENKDYIWLKSRISNLSKHFDKQ